MRVLNNSVVGEKRQRPDEAERVAGEKKSIKEASEALCILSGRIGDDSGQHAVHPPFETQLAQDDSESPDIKQEIGVDSGQPAVHPPVGNEQGNQSLLQKVQFQAQHLQSFEQDIQSQSKQIKLLETENQRFKDKINDLENENTVLKKPRIDTKQLPEGMYEGELVIGRATGQGSLTYKPNDQNNRLSYEGQWEDNKIHGQGTMKHEDGRSYEGQWEDNKIHGQGTMKYEDGSSYKGQWEDGERHGQGTFTRADKTVLTPVEGKGCFKNGHMAGSFNKKSQTGQGLLSETLEWKDGSSYKGKRKDDKRHGQGTLEDEDGTSYEGQWKDDKRHGHGKMKDKDGSYEGQWKDDKRHGRGTYKWANGDLFEGRWENNEENGKGTMKLENGNSYEGKWRMGERYGHITFNFENGDYNGYSYRGGVKDGRPYNNLVHNTLNTHFQRVDLQGSVFKYESKYTCPNKTKTVFGPTFFIETHNRKRRGPF